MSENVKIERKGDKLLLEIDIGTKAKSAARASASGKTRVIAKTPGFVAVEGAADGLKVSILATIPV